jgi:hypothetical protein
MWRSSGSHGKMDPDVARERSTTRIVSAAKLPQFSGKFTRNLAQRNSDTRNVVAYFLMCFFCSGMLPAMLPTGGACGHLLPDYTTSHPEGQQACYFVFTPAKHSNLISLAGEVYLVSEVHTVADTVTFVYIFPFTICFDLTRSSSRTCGSVVVETLYYKPEGRGFETRRGHSIISIHHIFPAALGLDVYSAYRRREYQTQK